MRFVDVYQTRGAAKVLYELLREREKKVNISHKRMPTMRQHLAFIRSRPYKAWYLISDGPGSFAGGIYLSKQDEVGVFIFKRHRGKGVGRRAIQGLMKRHKGVKRFLANVNPANTRSIRFFRDLKFRHLQNTFEFTRSG